MFWVDMHDPGIEVKPIHQMSGGSGFNEVFFTNVRVRDSQRLGAVDDGWKVSLVTLMNERLAVGGATRAGWRGVIHPPRAPPRAPRRAPVKGKAPRGKLPPRDRPPPRPQHT